MFRILKDVDSYSHERNLIVVPLILSQSSESRIQRFKGLNTE